MSNEEKEYDHYKKMQYLLMADFLVALDKARKNGVGEEWLHSFFSAQFVNITHAGFRDATAIANKEWDL